MTLHRASSVLSCGLWGGSIKHELAFCEWSISLGQVLVRGISHFEVALRNAYDRAMCEFWIDSAHWQLDNAFPVRRPTMRRSKQGGARHQPQDNQHGGAPTLRKHGARLNHREPHPTNLNLPLPRWHIELRFWHGARNGERRQA